MKNNHLFCKVFSCILVISMFLFLSACGKTQIEKAQDKVVSIGKQYLDYQISADEACEQLHSIAVPTTDGVGDTLLSGEINNLALLIKFTKTGADRLDDIQEKIQKIKKYDYTE